MMQNVKIVAPQIHLREIRATLNRIAHGFDDCQGSAAAMRDLARDSLRNLDAAMAAQAAVPPADRVALAASVAELRALGASEDRGLTVAEGEAISLVLHELERLRVLPVPSPTMTAAEARAILQEEYRVNTQAMQALAQDVLAASQLAPSAMALTRMAYELGLVPAGQPVDVQMLDVLRSQYVAALKVAAMVVQRAPLPDDPDRTLLDWLEREGTVDFSFETATVRFPVPDALLGGNSLREIVEAARLHHEQALANA